MDLGKTKSSVDNETSTDIVHHHLIPKKKTSHGTNEQKVKPDIEDDEEEYLEGS